MMEAQVLLLLHSSEISLYSKYLFFLNFNTKLEIKKLPFSQKLIKLKMNKTSLKKFFYCILDYFVGILIAFLFCRYFIFTLLFFKNKKIDYGIFILSLLLFGKSLKTISFLKPIF